MSRSLTQALMALLLFPLMYLLFTHWTSSSVVDDAVERYRIVAESGDAQARCVQAGAVAAAQLYAKNQGAYEEWRAVEKRDCAAPR